MHENKTALVAHTPAHFMNEIADLIHASKQRMAVSVNAELTLLYWHIGQRINQHILSGERASYGQEIIRSLAKNLTQQFGKGWSRTQLAYCVKFAETFADVEIVHALRGQLSWTHFKTLIQELNMLRERAIGSTIAYRR